VRVVVAPKIPIGILEQLATTTKRGQEKRTAEKWAISI